MQSQIFKSPGSPGESIWGGDEAARHYTFSEQFFQYFILHINITVRLTHICIMVRLRKKMKKKQQIEHL